MKKTGIELITEERAEQLKYHDKSLSHALQHSEGQLKLAATFALEPHEELKGITIYGGWNWFTDKIKGKPEIDRLKIAGALIAAEIDRLNN